MWGGPTNPGINNNPPPPPNTNNMGGVYGPGGGQQQQQQQTGQKHDIFVGNLSFNTTEEQLHVAFSEIGRVLNVRMVLDQEGKSKGYAFVEFEDPQAALSAIRNMNEYELNGRRLRVNFSNSSHLETLAEKLGMDLTANKNTSSQKSNKSATDKNQGTQAVADALKNFSKAEMYDVVKQFKDISKRDPDEARRLISSHPQLPEALLYCMSKLEMIQTPLPTTTTTATPSLSLSVAPPTIPTTTAVRPSDPRAAARMDPRVQPPPPPRTMDPRQQAPRVTDPRAAARAPPYPTTMAPQQQPGLAHLDPGLVQQVLSITPQQLAQLPPDKQQSILQLRQQITNGRG